MIIPPPNGATRFDDHLLSALNDYGIDTLDLSKKEFNKQDYFQGDGHWNEDGHQKAARYLVLFAGSLIDE
jgi:hypothetical protein